MMNKLIATGACALFLVGCSGEPAKTDTNTPPAKTAAATDTSAKFDLGKDI